jgi:phage tail-like protein
MGDYVAGVSDVSALRRVTEVVALEEPSDAAGRHVLPGTTRYDPIMLRRGRTHDDAFSNGRTRSQIRDPAVSARDIAIDLFDDAGQRVMSFRVRECWPSEYIALGEIESDGGMVAFESLTLTHEGFERDHSV